MPTLDKTQLKLGFRCNVAFGLILTAFFIIALRLWFLQILQGEYYRERSENNRLRTVYVPPPRGLIFDRNGKLLVRNRPSFNVEFVPEDSRNQKETIAKLATLLGIDPEELKNRLRADNNRRRRFEPKILLKDVPREVVAKVSAARYELPGVVVNVDPARDHIYQNLAAHALGYIREITNYQLESPAYSAYRFGDLVGQFGLEARWERLLQGQRGVQSVIVDAMGNRIGESSFQQEKSGTNLTLTLDFAVQQAADQALLGKKGAIVALDANTGAVLAMSSSPSFDPNIFTKEVTPAIWRELMASKEKRLNNRAIQGAYPPGSVFKVFMSAAILSEGVAKPTERVHCPGFLTFGGRPFRCWKKTGHGSVDIDEAIIQSCDVYYYTMGNRLGVDRIHDYATRFGLGSPSGLDLSQENKGLIPSTAWRRASSSRPERQKWYPGETLSVVIGQGAVTATPIQLARALASVVNGGRLVRPYLVERAVAADGAILEEHRPGEGMKVIDISPKVLEAVKRGLLGVVNDPRGTAKAAKLNKELNILVGGKTGTAQVVSLEKTRTHGETADHAWFAGYAPADDPRIVVVALHENGGHGGSAAAPLVRQVMEAYFAPDLKIEGAPDGAPLPTEPGAED